MFVISEYSADYIAEPKLTLKRALDPALAIEAADKDASEIRKVDGQGGDASVNKVDVKVNKGSEVKCSRCGGNHYPKSCHFKDAKCYCCSKFGRLARLCPAKKKGKQPQPVNEQKSGNSEPTNILEGAMQTPGEEQGVGAYSLFNFGSQRPLPYKVKLSVARQALQLVQSGIVLRTYTEEEVKPKGSCSVSVCYDGVEYSWPLLVVGGKGPALLGRNWLEKIKLSWPIIKPLSSHNKRLEEILHKHAQLFEEGLGTLQGAKAKSKLTPLLPLSSIKPDQYCML